jgi:hypothetical protein
MPYFTCSRCRMTYYSAASWAYAPECPRCLEPLNRPGLVSDRVVSIARRSTGDDRDTRPEPGRTSLDAPAAE